MATADIIRDTASTIVHLLQVGVPPLVPSTQIKVATPDEFEDLRDPHTPNVTVFLYRIAVNPQMRNAPPRLLPDGKIAPPRLPLDLSFLVTAWAKETRDELRIVGRIIQVLQDSAEVGPADLQGNSWEPDDSLQLALESLPLEDHYRIWDATTIPYRLSLTYVARVVGVASKEQLAPPPVIDARIGGRA